MICRSDGEELEEKEYLKLIEDCQILEHFDQPLDKAAAMFKMGIAGT
jgi:hypothetical protein